ncbi:hypothetical protein Acj133p222 [Acinetobacter phage 133]|uniref:Uncharacterized protein n=1 Tax=Acinetobacter phage 133 TaxID=2919552 RepID=D9I6F6_9CAUD|nr:hypothetical protein Acj133p222 [Acinetobacter phage 133]ADJ19537.1 hypothetical protein Acj133p222 [Acinetobacter phage 133]
MSLKTVGYILLIAYLYNTLYSKIDRQNSVIFYQQAEISDLKYKLSKFEEPPVKVINVEPIYLKLFGNLDEGNENESKGTR